MYKLVIVEDEKDVRDRIAKMVEKSTSKFSVASWYENGIDAYDGVISDSPDLLLTDIRIPYINGIDLAKKVREVFPLIKIIIITGYNEFDYAKEAANLGVVGFISKPVTFAELDELLNKSEELLNSEYLVASNLSQLSDFYNQNLHVTKEYCLCRLSTMSKLTPAFEARLKGNGINLSHRYFIMCIFDFDQAEEAEERHELAFSFVRKLAGEELYGLYEYETFNRHENLCVLLKTNQPPDAADIERRFGRIVQRTGRYSDMPLSVGISAVHENDGDFQSMVKEAKQALMYRSVIGGVRVFLNKDVAHSDAKLSLTSNVEHSLRKILAYMEAHYQDPAINLETLASGVGFSVSYISALLKKMLDSSFVRLITNMRMVKAKELLADPSLKIIDVAESVGYSDSYYFSHCFKKFAGVSPKEYKNNEQRKYSV